MFERDVAGVWAMKLLRRGIADWERLGVRGRADCGCCSTVGVGSWWAAAGGCCGVCGSRGELGMDWVGVKLCERRWRAASRLDCIAGVAMVMARERVRLWELSFSAFSSSGCALRVRNDVDRRVSRLLGVVVVVCCWGSGCGCGCGFAGGAAGVCDGGCCCCGIGCSGIGGGSSW